MIIPTLIASLVSSIYAASIVSRQSSPLPQPVVLGPQTILTIGNGVIAPDGFERSATLVNGIFPGPLITAQKGDSFAIEVVNQLEDETMFKSTSVHWHGIYQNGTNYADGTSFVTQCPIAQNHSFLHTFSVPNQAGTYWYHSHYSVQYCDGLRGALVIYDPQDPLAYMYDVDDASTVITLSDWYHVVAPILRHIIGTTANSSLINGLGRYAGGPASDLAFSIDGHNFTVIEADGLQTEPLVVDQLQIFAGQRYSVVLVADMPVDNYWMRSLPNLVGASFVGGTNSAILRYQGAAQVDPITVLLAFQGMGMQISILDLQVANTGGTFYVNGIPFKSPTVPVLLQILSGAQDASQLLPNGSVIVLEANKVVELTMSTTGPGGPHPIHLHGHAFDVVQSAGSSTLNYVNPVRRDVVSAGGTGQQMVIRWTTDNSGPWFLHCHIDWHLDAGFAVVMAESPSDTAAHVNPVPEAWDELCPIFDSLTPLQLGGGGQFSYDEAANISGAVLFPPSPLP
ncbi:laccase [Suillus lakei]|nr:laccase [Suillus lakei]